MTIKLGSIRANLTRENDGDWIEIPELSGVRLRVRGASYGPYQAAKSIVEARWARLYGTRKPVPPETSFKENGRLYAEHILLEWDGFDEPYDEDRARDVLTDPAYRELHELIRYAMGEVAATEAEFITDAAKN